MVLAGQAVEGEGLLDIVFNPADELFVAAAPFGDPSREIAAGFLDRASIVESAQLLQAVAVGLARQMVESICGGSGRSTVGRRPRREPLEWPCAVRRDRRRRRTRRHAGPAGAKKGGSLSRMIGSRGWPSRRRGSGGARPSRRRWFSRSGPDRFATCPLTQGTLLRVLMRLALDSSASAAWQALREITRLLRPVCPGLCWVGVYRRPSSRSRRTFGAVVRNSLQKPSCSEPRT